MSKNTSQLYAHVAPAIPLKSEAPQWFTYAVSPDIRDQLSLYSRVLVSFGKRLLPGIVLDIHSTIPPYATKSLRLLPGEGLTGLQVQFATWIAQTMQGGLGYTLRLFTPPPGEVPLPPPASVRLGKVGKPLPRASVILRALEKKTVLYVEGNRALRFEVVRDVVIAYWRQKKQILCLVPEKWMIEPLSTLFSLLPGVAIVHGSLTPSKQKDVWYRVKSGHIRVVIGTQKALFLPFKNLGLIILEEEQHASHKLWDQYPRLDNQYAVKQLQLLYGCHVLLTTSFPSLTSYAAGEAGALKVIGTGIVKPKVKLIASTFADQRSRYLLPNEFTTALKRWHRNNQRVFILHGRKGSWNTVVCLSCHKAVRCPECELPFIIRGSGKKSQLHCHGCNISQEMPKACPMCHKGKLRFFGPGAETVASTLSSLIPSSDVVSLDADSMKKLTPKALKQSLTAHSVVLGTSTLLRQDLPETFDQLVWLFPESSLLYPDVRTHERHLIELARLQSLSPSSPITIVTRQGELVKKDLIPPVSKLYPLLLKERTRLHYPPTTDMVRLSITGTTTHQAMKKGTYVREAIEKRIALMKEASPSVRVRGPFQSFQKRERKKYQVHILLLGDLKQLTGLYRGLPIDIVDLDPQRIM